MRRRRIADYLFSHVPDRATRLIKKALKELIEDLEGSRGESAQKELKALQSRQNAIARIETRVKDGKAALKTLTDELESSCS